MTRVSQSLSADFAQSQWSRREQGTEGLTEIHVVCVCLSVLRVCC
jgi:hypothetical protein